MLPSYELGFYALVVTSAVVYSSSGIFEASRGNAPHHIPPEGALGGRLDVTWLLLQLSIPAADPWL